MGMDSATTRHNRGAAGYFMNNLVKYNAARTALAEAHAIDEVKDIRDKAEAMAAYARQAKDTEMIAWVTEIKVRAERRAGQMLAELELKPGPNPIGNTLVSIGVTKNQSSRWQKLASVADDKFEHAVAAAKDIAGEVTTAAMMRAAKQDAQGETKAVERPGAKTPEPLAPVEEYSQVDAMRDQIDELQSALSAAHMKESTDEEKALHVELVASLQKELKMANSIIAAVTRSRDQYMAECGQLKRQIAMMQRQQKKAA